MRLPLAIVLAFLIFMPFAPSYGKVFWSRLLNKSASIFDPSGNWTQLYKCAMTINGARASLAVYDSEDSLRSLTAKLKQNSSSNNQSQFIESGNTTQVASSDHDRTTRLVILAMPATDKSVIFELIQQPKDKGKPAALSQESMVFGRSLPVGSVMTATIRNEDTGAVLETMTSPLPPDLFFNWLAGQLARDGWNNIPPPGDNSAAPGYFGIFQRKDALCIVMVGHDLRENKTCVTILSKEINRQ